MTFVVKCAPVLKEWNYCCCSCSLRGASIVLAWFAMITNVSQFVTLIVYLAHPVIGYGRHEATEVVASLLSGLVGSLILNALLLYGIHRKKPVYMLPFLVMDLIALVILAGAILLLTVYIIPLNWIIGIMIFVGGSAVLALTTFFWVVHYSYYRQIDEEKNASCGIVNYTYGIPSEHVQITACSEDEKALCPYSSKASAEVA